MKAPLVAIALGALTFTAPARAANEPARDVAAIDESAKAAYEEGKYAFCTAPARPLGVRQRALCALAAEIDGCEGLQKACNVHDAPKDRGWLERMAEWLGPAATVLLYVLVGVIVIVVAIPVIRALLKRRRDKKLAGREPPAPNRARLLEEAPVIAEEVSDAEAALRLAEAHRTRGELKEALGLYLAASLAALDRRGAIRVARHRTNGEYVRACEEEGSRAPLREIVREVDRVEFGGAPPNDDRVARVASRAAAIVRVTASAMLVLALGFSASGCSAPQRGADPAGTELPIAVLERNGFRVGTLETSLATLPIPEGDAAPSAMPVVVVDMEKVPIEGEAAAHMMRWVEAGGVLVLLGHVDDWPSELRSKEVPAETRDLVVRAVVPHDALADLEADEDAEDLFVPIEVKGARTARRDAFAWNGADEDEPLAFLGAATYASKRRVGKGAVLGVANDDLFTNVGMMPAHNAAALVTLIRAAAHDPARLTSSGSASLGDVRVARTEDGIPPPANPFAALIAAGLGKGAWHALAAAIVLFLAYGIRHARPRAVEARGRRAFAEHIEATGAFYGKTRAHTHALGAYGRFVEMRLRESLPRGADPVLFLAARSGADPARVAEIYARALEAKAGDVARGDELSLIEELRRLADKALGGSRRHER
ncbi:MAG: DUF4129 domain-containing protein [Labilithrix sp.]|nr:DUF4129 domain-containing protein [Labilithrix sp.]